MSERRPRAVLFDLGGVVLESPLHLIAEFEREHGLPDNLIARVVGGYATRTDGPWQRLERGEIPLASFCAAFDAEVAGTGHRVRSAELMAKMARHTTIRPVMLEAIRRLRRAAVRVGALTNNWDWGAGAPSLGPFESLRGELDVLVESWRAGLRKPDPRIYDLALRELGVPAADAVFLDDIGSNLKPARALGMTTIKVVEPRAALRELERAVGLPLLG